MDLLDLLFKRSMWSSNKISKCIAIGQGRERLLQTLSQVPVCVCTCEFFSKDRLEVDTRTFGQPRSQSETQMLWPSLRTVIFMVLIWPIPYNYESRQVIYCNRFPELQTWKGYEELIIHCLHFKNNEIVSTFCHTHYECSKIQILQIHLRNCPMVTSLWQQSDLSLGLLTLVLILFIVLYQL